MKPSLTLLLGACVLSGPGASRLGAAEPCDLLLAGGTVVTMDAGYRVFEPGAVE